MKLTLNAPAKVNLCLAVQYPPVDGYHTLTSVFQALDLHDTLEFEIVESEEGDQIDGHAFDSNAQAPDASAQAEHAAIAGQATSATSRAVPTRMGTPVLLDCGTLDVPVRDNLIFKAIDQAEEACGTPAAPAGNMLSIRVHKRIPAGGGLGGGSSDAAAALKAYAQIAGVDPLDERLRACARNLGADVAFFMYGGCALMEGRGDTLLRKLPAFPFPLVLMGESEGISTASVYAAFDEDPVPPGLAFTLAAGIEAWQSTSSPSNDSTASEQGAHEQHDAHAVTDAERIKTLTLAKLCTNNLEPAACAALPRLEQRIRRASESPHVLHALVTGSGATSYAICAGLESAQAFEQEIAPLCAWTHICIPGNQS